MKLITVTATQGGWVVDQAADVNPLMFLAGGKAEKKARELAVQAARVGEPAEVRIHDLEGGLVGQIRYEAAE
jgi:hypothetical protein